MQFHEFFHKFRFLFVFHKNMDKKQFRWKPTGAGWRLLAASQCRCRPPRWRCPPPSCPPCPPARPSRTARTSGPIKRAHAHVHAHCIIHHATHGWKSGFISCVFFPMNLNEFEQNKFAILEIQLIVFSVDKQFNWEQKWFLKSLLENMFSKVQEEKYSPGFPI